MTRIFLLLLLFLSSQTFAASFIVENGQAKATIVIASEASRSTRWAAKELQETIEKISGAKLAIAHQPGKAPSIFVGESKYLLDLGVNADGLKHGAYRIVSGDNWLALLGDDTPFEPTEPWAKNNNGRKSLQTRWEEESGLPYGVPNGGMHKNRRRMPEDIAKEQGEIFWGFDERGSYNAVCGFLRDLGARWYMPGDLGEVLPKTASIRLPKVDKTVNPDFEVRQFSARIGNCDDEITRWIMRLGTRNVSGLMIAHGMDTMTHPDQLRTDKPDWFALYGGKRNTQIGKRLNHLCYSNEELFKETVKWAQAQFDVYDFEGVSIMPPDAYISICQCERCKGKQVDAMGSRGKLSNHVWDFVNRVAKEVKKTHPDKKIVCCAYGANTNPPTNIKKLESNVQVVIVGGRRPRNSLPEQRESIDNLREGWLKIATLPIMIFENYPFTARGIYLPAFVARVNGESINATKGLSRGEDIWLSFPRYHDDPNIGFDHFQIYMTARMYWGGKNADFEALLEEYCQKFYGSAGSQMHAFFDFCESNYQAMDTSLEPVQTALAMFASAQSSVDPDSIYAQRMALIDQFLVRLRSKANQLAQGRGPVPRVRTVWESNEPIVIDGKLDEPYWEQHRNWTVSRLRELQTGGQPVFGTSVLAGWDRSGSNLYVAIRCQEQPGEPLNVATKDREDQSIWYGDCIEILLETDAHRYYQIAVNPAGALIDLDRGAGKSGWFRWESQAEVATQIAEDHWTVEIRIPVTEDDNDPLNQVVGHKPSHSLPWHFNICRQRVRENATERSAISPTGSDSFHVPLKFAHFYDGRSQAFEVDETVTDFLIEFNKASKLNTQRQTAKAMNAFTALADHPKATEIQKSRVLAEAAACARLLRDAQKAAELTDQIPIETTAKISKMKNLAAQRMWSEIVAEFGNEDLTQWPFTEVGEAASVRGRAHSGAKNGQQADDDFQLSLRNTTDPRRKTSVLAAMARNREVVLKDNDLALDSYLQIASSGSNATGADLFAGVQGAVRILAKRSQFDRAIALLEQVDSKRISGSRAVMMLQLKAETLSKMGRKQEAIEAYNAIRKHDSANPSQKKKAESAIATLQNK